VAGRGRWTVEASIVDQIYSGALLKDERHVSKSALRALEVLEFFAARRRPARATEVARSLGLSPSTADQLLKTLASRAYLILDVRRKLYHPSPRLLGFAALLGRSYFGGDRLEALMRDLVDRTGCTAAISTPLGRLMQLVKFVAPPGHARQNAPGSLFPMFSSASGAAILATWPRSTVRLMVEQSEDQLGDLAGRPDLVLERLREIRADGHAFGGLSEEPERCSIAVALPQAGFGTELSLSLASPAPDLRARRWRLSAIMQEAVAAHLGEEDEARPAPEPVYG
jgi:DNA-binding IclR family transcriptional regulator